MTAGKLLKALRKELGWTQKAMAKRLGISPPTLSRIEKGKLEPSLEAFRRAAGISVQHASDGLYEAIGKFLYRG